MAFSAKEILEELKGVLKGKTIDAIIPPLVFLIMNGFTTLNIAIITSLSIAVLLGISRIFRKQNILYVGIGFIGLTVAFLFAYLSDNASNYFLPSIIGSGFLAVVSFVSVIAKRPIAALASHITRGWTFTWFLRKDVRPAYSEVSILWGSYFLFRALIQLSFLLEGSLSDLTLLNIILGLPFTVVVLIISYVYGIWRLRKLGGPGIDEFDQGATPPYKGQTRGF